MDPALRPVVLVFVEELRDQLDRIRATLAAMERDAALVPAEIEELFRQAHSWKGSAASLGLDDLATLAHELESALTPVRRGAAPLTPALADVAIVAVDAAGARIPGLVAESNEGCDEVAAATRELRALLGEGAVPAAAGAEGARPGEPDAREGEPEARSEPVVDPASESVRVTVARLTELERGLDDLRGLRSRIETQAEGAVAAVHGVDQLWRAARDGHRIEPGPLFALLSRLRGMRRALVDDADALQSQVVAVDETLRAMRMVPAGNLGEPLGRALRDACKRTGKQARLVVEGGEVQLDRHVLEELKGPLIHLVRNAIDHGIEEPEVREAIGKPARARVELVVRQELRTLHLEVRDDGRGVDVEAAREQARVRGLVSDAEAERLDEAQVIDLLFRSGFSTAAEVTELSGRGVGLDVVRDAATRLQGSASMTSTMGRGSAVHLTVPLTVAAHSGIVVEERGRRFALPLAQVERVVRATAAELRDDGARTVFDLDDEPLPIARLSTLLDAPARGGKSAVTILVARAGEGRVGIVCERLIGQRELLLRPLPTELSTLDHISGVALLPSGEAIFVLSPVVLARQPQQRRKTTPSAPRERAVLIADDSITIRSLLRHALEAAGFRVRTATDGEEALQLAGLERFDLVVADVRMPRVDGLQLTARLRASPRTARLPVVLFSSLASTQDREAGRAAGASAYLSKREFDRGELVDVITGLLKERA
ncbi:MAG TPA: response regulator [Polyangia bacterium]|nr:response regulator [Polyangia bacterium]